MYLYVEQWNVTQKWMELPKEKRQEYMDQLRKTIEDLKQKGIENIGWSMNDEHTPYRSDYRYLAVWKIPSLEAVETMEKGFGSTQWHKYFSQVNSRGKIVPMNEAIDFLINLKKQSTSILE